MRLFPETQASRAKERISTLEHLNRMSAGEEATAEMSLRSTLSEALVKNEKYRPSPAASSMGWKRHG